VAPLPAPFPSSVYLFYLSIHPSIHPSLPFPSTKKKKKKKENPKKKQRKKEEKKEYLSILSSQYMIYIDMYIHNERT
jgi:hypothetical protein